jgi:hypothetical protein
MASAVNARAASRTSAGTLGLPPGFRACPGCTGLRLCPREQRAMRRLLEPSARSDWRRSITRVSGTTPRCRTRSSLRRRAMRSTGPTPSDDWLTGFTRLRPPCARERGQTIRPVQSEGLGSTKIVVTGAETRRVAKRRTAAHYARSAFTCSTARVGAYYNVLARSPFRPVGWQADTRCQSRGPSEPLGGSERRRDCSEPPPS